MNALHVDSSKKQIAMIDGYKSTKQNEEEPELSWNFSRVATSLDTNIEKKWCNKENMEKKDKVTCNEDRHYIISLDLISSNSS